MEKPMPVKHLVFAVLLAAVSLLQPAQARPVMPVVAIGTIDELPAVNGVKTPVVEVLSYHAGCAKAAACLSGMQRHKARRMIASLLPRAPAKRAAGCARFQARWIRPCAAPIGTAPMTMPPF
jgi:hypothetical protein